MARALATALKTPAAVPLLPATPPAIDVVPVSGTEAAEALPVQSNGPHAVTPHATVPPSRAEPRALSEPRAGAASEAPIDAERLAEEVALVDQARGALARGDGAAAITALDSYQARFKQPKFAPEALYLRMESLLRLGRAAAARAVAERLVSEYPRSPHTARARQVMSETIP